jgi:hypothetical protein
MIGTSPTQGAPAARRWLCLVATEPGQGFLVRWRSQERTLAAHPPTLTSVALREVACATVDASEMECVVIDQPFRAHEHEVIPNGLLRVTLPAGTLDDLTPGPDHPLACALAFVAPDGTACVEGEDYEVLRAVTLRTELVPDAEEPVVPASDPDADD